MAGLDQSIDRDNGILDYCRLNDITLQAWSPFQKGFFNGVFLGDRENYAELNDVLDELAAAHGVTPTGIAVAWITRHPAQHPGRARHDQAGARARVGRRLGRPAHPRRSGTDSSPPPATSSLNAWRSPRRGGGACRASVP